MAMLSEGAGQRLVERHRCGKAGVSVMAVGTKRRRIELKECTPSSRKVATMVSTMVELERFDGKGDFALWKQRMKVILVQMKMAKALIVNGIPDTVSAADKEEMQKMAYSTLTLHLGDKVLRDVSKEKTAAGNIKEKIEDEDQAIMILNALPLSYAIFVDTMKYSRETLSMEDVLAALKQKQLEQKPKREVADGLVAHGGFQKRNFQKKSGFQKSQGKHGSNTSQQADQKKFKYFFCHKIGHWRKDYPERKKNLGQKDQEKGDAAMAEEAYGNAEALTVTQTCPTSRWILDSGCSYHMTPHKEWLMDYIEKDQGTVHLGNNKACKMVGIGTIWIKMADGPEFKLSGVRYVPDLKRNLVFLGMLEAHGCIFKAKNGFIEVFKGNVLKLKGNRQNGIYVLEGNTMMLTDVNYSEFDKDRTVLWHLRLGHLGKSTKSSFGKGKHVTKAKLDYIHSDLWGPTRVQSHGGKRYFMSLIDDFTRRSWVYLLAHKSEAFETFKNWKMMVENLSGQKNGLAERFNRTLLERVRCMLIQSDEYDMLRIFGCAAYATVKQSKLEPRALKCVFIGYPDGTLAYKLWCLEDGHKRVIISKDVRVDESTFPYKKNAKQVELSLEKDDTDLVSRTDGVEPEVEREHDNSPDVILESQSNEDETTENNDHNESNDYWLTRDRPRRNHRAPVMYGFEDMVNYACNVAENISNHEPENVQDAVYGPEGNRWLKAINDEMDSLKKNKTWKIVDRPAKTRLVGSKWIFTRKEVTYYDYELEQLDVKIAFLHGNLDETINMRQPEGFIIGDPEKKVCLLKRSLYGLKQSPRLWYRRFDEFMFNCGFKRLDYDWCIFYKHVQGQSVIYLLLYVDDMLIASHDMTAINDLEVQLHTNFEMKDFGGAKKILVGCLMYAMVCTRPDIAHGVSLKVVALSTIEAEFMAITEAVKEALWMKGLMTELGHGQSCGKVHSDSQGAIHLSKHHVFHERSKHIDVRMHFVRDVADFGVVQVVKIGTKENPADMLTKSDERRGAYGLSKQLTTKAFMAKRISEDQLDRLDDTGPNIVVLVRMKVKLCRIGEERRLQVAKRLSYQSKGVFSIAATENVDKELYEDAAEELGLPMDVLEKLLTDRDEIARFMKMERKSPVIEAPAYQLSSSSSNWFPYLDTYKVGQTVITSADVLEALDPFIMETRKERFRTAVRNRTYSVCLVIEGLNDVANASAIFRSADALGFQSVHVIAFDCSKRFRENRHVSVGAEKWLDIELWESTKECFDALKSRGYCIAATHVGTKAVPVYEMDWSGPTAIVVGNETRGITDEAIELADTIFNIPMKGMVESFNVSVASALIMHHALCSRTSRLGCHGDLTPLEQQILLAEFSLRHSNNAVSIVHEHTRRKLHMPKL
ncbi:unnamed protein product [Rhodiola kirilowii]